MLTAIKAMARSLFGRPNANVGPRIKGDLLGRLRGDTTEVRLRYVLEEIAYMRELLRLLCAESERFRDYVRQSGSSFDVQWHRLPHGAQLGESDVFRRESAELIERYTGLDQDWFNGRRVLDAGCGNGRWSWALASLGAQVTAMDQSMEGVGQTAALCSSFPDVRVKQHDLLRPLPFGAEFDLAWSFGVVHHTGNTRAAIKNVCATVRSGGLVFFMIYGTPRYGHSGDFVELNSYMNLRRELRALSFDERIEFLRARYPEELVHGWFDAASPAINDLHSFEEIAQILRSLGFGNIRRTHPNRNLFIIAQRV